MGREKGKEMEEYEEQIKKVLRIVGKIILVVASIVDNFGQELAWLTSFLISVGCGISWSKGEDTGLVVLGWFLVLTILFPVLRLILSLLMVIPQFICHIGLKIYYMYVEQQLKKEGFYYEDNGWRDRYENSESEESEEDEDEESEFSHQKENVYLEAVRFFGLTYPFTEADLKTAYRKVMKKAHPDAGGTTEMAEKVNYYYEYLKKML